jgi:hypothetical protein
LTVTVKVTSPALALESTAEHVTFVRPTRKKRPDAGLQVAGTLPSTASVAVTA